MYIIGTAGHVDHGKTTLVKALTGTDTDRLPEEKRRSVTIELGFASYTDRTGEMIGVVDVPGHERFIRNMVGGMWALDCALLVVAADDGWMRQSEDHLHILAGMQVPAVVVVVAKCDTSSETRISEVSKTAEARCQAVLGYVPPIAEVSALHHHGLDLLKSVIEVALRGGKKAVYPTCLYIDRSFVLDGIGPVVTGSLQGGPLSVGDQITVLPSGRQGRIRSLQIFGRQSNQAEARSRTAIGIQGIASEDLQRGDCLTTKVESFSTVSQAVVVLHAPVQGEFLTIKNHGTLEIAYGTAHNSCAIHYITPFDRMEQKAFAIARIVCSKPPSWFENQPFICMQPGGSTVLARANVITTDPLVVSALKKMAATCAEMGQVPPEFTERDLRRLYLDGYGTVERSNDAILQLLEETFIRFESWYVREKLAKTVIREVTKRAEQPQGIGLQTAKQQQKIPHHITEAIIQQMLKKEEITLTDGILHSAQRTTERLSPEAQRLYEKIDLTGFEGYPVKSIQKQEKELVGSLLRVGRIVMVESTFLYPATTYRTMTALVLKGRVEGDTFTIGEAKQHLPLSRKFMIPLLNRMESDGLIERFGDVRKVLRIP